MNREQMITLAREEAQRNGLRPELLLGLLEHESGFDAKARSKAGALGVAQLMPATARELGVDALDPAQAIAGAARYLAAQLRQFGSEKSALQAYNWGPGNVASYLARGHGLQTRSNPSGAMPDETRAYVSAVQQRAVRHGGLPPADFQVTANTHTPLAPVSTPDGWALMAPSTPEEADLLHGIAARQHPPETEHRIATAMASILPARDILDAGDILGGAHLPGDLDALLAELIEKA